VDKMKPTKNQRDQSDKTGPSLQPTKQLPSAKKKGGSQTAARTTPSAKASAENQRIFSAIDTIIEGTGVKSEDVSGLILCQTGGAILGHWLPKGTGAGEKLVVAANILTEMRPTNVTELMLAAQMVAVNEAVFLFMLQATLVETSLEKREFYTEKARKLMNMYVQQVDCMMRLKGKTGRQKVTVEHVHVHSGGQAIVGAVTAGELERGEGDGGKDRGNTP
jgi:hypothetical protein